MIYTFNGYWVHFEFMRLVFISPARGKKTHYYAENILCRKSRLKNRNKRSVPNKRNPSVHDFIFVFFVWLSIRFTVITSFLYFTRKYFFYRVAPFVNGQQYRPKGTKKTMEKRIMKRNAWKRYMWTSRKNKTKYKGKKKKAFQSHIVW